MKGHQALILVPSLFLVAFVIALAGCGKKEEVKTPAAQSSEEKIPVKTSSKEALSLFLEGRNLAENARSVDSERFFQMALEKDPNFAMAHLYLGMSAGPLREARNQLNQAIELSDPPGRCSAIRIRRSAEAERNFKKCIELSPSDANSYDSYAELLLKTGRFEEAILHRCYEAEERPAEILESAESQIFQIASREIKGGFERRVHMDLIAWLEDLAAAYRIEPSEMTTTRYLRSLERWPLNPMQWEQLSDEAVLRFGKFPSISELYEIACELQQRAQIRTNSEWLAKMRREWRPKQVN